MGRTTYNQRDSEEDDRNKKNSKNVKHSRNIPGKGMRVINSWYDEDEDFFEDEIQTGDSVDIMHYKSTR